MRRFVVFFLAICCFTGCVGSGKAKKTGEMPVPKITLDDPAIVPVSRSTQWWVDRHDTRIHDIIKNQKIIFIGDSITQGYERTEAWEELKTKYNNRITNLGFSGDRTEHVLWRLLNGEFPIGINPEYVVIMIGTNNNNEPESIAAGIGEILKTINATAPKSKILLFSLLPRGSGTDDSGTKRNYAVNQIIEKYDGYLNTKYIDISKYYVTDTGKLKEGLFSDRLHLTPEGYTIWKDKIIEILGKNQE